MQRQTQTQKAGLTGENEGREDLLAQLSHRSEARLPQPGPHCYALQMVVELSRRGVLQGHGQSCSRDA